MTTETFIQPKITGYRQLTETEAALMNECKALAEQCGELVKKLRTHPATAADGIPHLQVPGNTPSLDQRWVSMGASDLQVGFMKLIRGIAQPTTF